jgi:hypothetical protein
LTGIEAIVIFLEVLERVGRILNSGF